LLRFSSISICFCCLLVIVVALAAPLIPREAGPRQIPLPKPKIDQATLDRAATVVGGLLTRSSEPLRLSYSPRTVRERDGQTARATEVCCYDKNGELVSFMCWDVNSGKLLLFSRNNLRGLPAAPAAQKAEYARDAARNWLRMTDLGGACSNWRVTRVDPRTPIRWIVSAECGDRKAHIFVDRKTGAVVSMTTWRDWPAPERELASRAGAAGTAGTRAASRRNTR
jgi:hypothetical protein